MPNIPPIFCDGQAPHVFLPCGAFFVSLLGCLRLGGIQFVIISLFGHQLVVAAGFQNALVADIEDAVAALDGGQAVSHDEAGAALQQRFDALLQKALRLGVDGRSGLVQNEKRGSERSVRAKAISCRWP